MIAAAAYHPLTVWDLKRVYYATLLEEDGVRCRFPVKGGHLPIQLSPTPSSESRGGGTRLGSDPDSVIGWYRRRQTMIELMLDDFGAVLLRGFALPETKHFQAILSLHLPHAFGYVAGATPRKVIEGHVYESTRMPSPFKIGLHQEKAYMADYPRLIAFYCKRPSEHGGETPLCDMREVTRRLDLPLLERFRDKKVMYLRNFSAPENPSFAPPPPLFAEYHRPWKEAFSTESRARVESLCRERKLDFEWLPDGSISVFHVGPATVVHPRTGVETWFNQASAQHPNPRSMGKVSHRYLVHQYRNSAAFPYEVRFGDGSPMTLDDLVPIYDAIDAEEIAFPWQAGDLLVVDNVTVAHGRNPFRGKRNVQVAMMD